MRKRTVVLGATKGKEIEIGAALLSLRPNCKYHMIGNDYNMIQGWNDNGEDIPSKAEVDAEVIRLQAEYDANEYARNRWRDYPSNGDQWDMIYKDNKNSTTTHADAELDALESQADAVENLNEILSSRGRSYPKLAEQFDLLYHAIDDGALNKTSDFYTKLKKVKDDNPKP